MQAGFFGGVTRSDDDGMLDTRYEWSDADPVGTQQFNGGAVQPMSGDDVWLKKSVPHQDFSHEVNGGPQTVTHYYASGVKHKWQDADVKAKNSLSARCH